MKMLLSTVAALVCVISVGGQSLPGVPPPNECLPMPCPRPCPNGVVRDARGCDTCTCLDPCMWTKCSAGFECKVVDVQCFRAPCPQSAQCVPIDVKPKEGDCPAAGGLGNFMSMFGLCAERCDSDDQCPGVKKCCSNGCGHVCMDPAKPAITKEGKCPSSSTDFLFGFCLDMCQSDEHCPRNLKCCGAGCSKICLKPEPEDTRPKPGNCPTEKGDMGIWGLINICLQLCHIDASCPRDQKCCSNGCGMVCMKPKEPCPVFRCPECPFGYKTDSSGCNTCECKDPCEEIRCRYDEKCVVSPQIPGAFPHAECVPTVVCPAFRCAVYCEHGFEVDINGCESCTCVDPCKTVSFGPGEYCKVVPVFCFRAPCPPHAVCTPREACPAVMCASPVLCEYGFELDSRGCQTCECQDPCRELKCADNEECQYLPTPCAPGMNLPCLPQPVCVQRDPTVCPAVRCANDCQGLYVMDRNGCQTCECQNPCTTMWCPADTECQVIEVICKRAPCPPTAHCLTTVPIACPAVRCANDCQGLYVTDRNGCQTCECQNPCTTMTCPAGDECQVVEVMCIRAPCPPIAQCVPTVPTACPAVHCANDCQGLYVTDMNGCQTCECQNPCATMACPAGNECQVVEVMCIRAPCPPTARCVPTGPSVKAGECPTNDRDLFMVGICVEMCQSDNMCPGDEKCCSNGCGHLCMAPSPPVVGSPVCAIGEPLTNTDGERIYCGRGGSRCPPNSECKVDPGDRWAICCSTDPTHPCPEILCGECTYGYDLDVSGCPSCNCTEPCKDVRCRPGEECEVLDTPCFMAPCPPPQTSCRPTDPTRGKK